MRSGLESRRGPVRGPGREYGSEARNGFALLAVLLVLLALLVVATPFLLSARNADRSSGRRTEERSARLALDSAERRARATLGATHIALDETPHWDSTDELEVTNDFDPEVFRANDARGVMWDLEVEDLSGRIDLDTAPPQVLASAMGRATFLTRAVTPEEEELPAGRTTQFLEEGFVVVGGETIHYGLREGAGFQDLARGIGADPSEPCGPQPPGNHAAGAPVLDLLAWAVAAWRTTAADGEPRRLASLEELRDAVPALDDAALEALAAVGTVHGGVAAGPRWQHPTRLTSFVEPGETCTIRTDSVRWLAPGSTIQISDGSVSELAVVRSRASGAIELTEALVNEYNVDTAVVRVLVRRPVNLNTASSKVLMTLFEGLKLDGRNARITHAEALALATVVLESRPFEGFEDFLRRIVLPAGGLAPLPDDAPVVPEVFARAPGGGTPGGLIDEDDAYALYINGLNANDLALEFSTMPFTFTSRGVFDLELRAAVNASSGLERARAARRDVELIVPQGELLRVWSRQEDFEEELRLTRSAPWWTTGPENVSPYDGALDAVPPGRAPAHLGLLAEAASDGQAQPDPYVFPDPTAEEGWARLWPARVHEQGVPDSVRVEHFERESSDHEGRYLADGPLTRPASWADLDPNGLAAAFSASMWIKPRAAGPGLLLDLGGGYQESDRVELELTSEDLVLRVRDGAGDHPGTGFEELTEVKVPRAQLPVDVWSHVAVDVRGNRPEQMSVFVDGMARGEANVMTRLSGPLGPNATFIPVESTEGFPDPCVLRIGDEIVEARIGGNGFDASHNVTGQYAGFGGRWARESFQHLNAPADVEQPGVNDAVSIGKQTSHPAGTSVTLYGYSTPVAANVSNSSGSLPGPLGRFAVARAVGVRIGGDEGAGEPIIVQIQLNDGTTVPIQVGVGMDGSQGSGVEAIELGPAGSESQLIDAADVAEAFAPGGGYALLAQRDLAYAGSTDNKTTSGAPLVGLEVIRYSGVQDGFLLISERGDQHALQKSGKDTRAYIFHHNPGVIFGGGPNAGQSLANFLGLQTFVIPISIPGGGGGAGFTPPTNGSEFAQLTHTGNERDQTEWVRYDEVVSGELVRSDRDALEVARVAAVAGVSALLTGDTGELDGDDDDDDDGGGDDTGGPGPTGGPPEPGPGGTTGTAGGPGGSGGAGGAGGALQLGLLPAAFAQSSSAWLPLLGRMESDYADLPVTLSVATQFQFRGVLGTSSHAHAAGTTVLPVWKVSDPDAALGLDWGHPGYGWPGAFDPVMLVESSTVDPGWPGVVHHAQRARQYSLVSWSEDQGDTMAGIFDPEVIALDHVGFDTEVLYVALSEAAPIALAAGGSGGTAGGSTLDSRTVTRVTKFPSGELPRAVTTVAVGQNHQGGGEVPPVVIDELVFSSSSFYGGAGALQGALLELSADLPDGALSMQTDTFAMHAGGRRRIQGTSPLAELPQDGGLLRIGEEIVGYVELDVASGVVTLAPDGRGMLGSEARGHSRGELVTPLTFISASPVSGGIGPTESVIGLEDLTDFPPMGLLRIGDELIHYSQLVQGAAWMPRASREAGAFDAEGPGLFRGRFGTLPATHPGDSLAVVVPFRYWDRWEQRADSADLGFFGLTADQPGAYWGEVLFEVRDPGLDGVRAGVLMRSRPDVPWDADPDVVEGLDLLEPGQPGQRPTVIGRFADRVEWRVFVDYGPGAYDPVDGILHGWKTTPRLEILGVSFEAPGRLLARIER